MNVLEQSDDPKDRHTEAKSGLALGNLDLRNTSFKSYEGNNDDDTSSDESLDEENDSSSIFNDKMEIWEPPQAENEYDNEEISMATLDDEDDEDANGDATGWGKPHSWNGLEEGVSRSYSFREENQKAMEEVMNGKFKDLVSQLLKKLGVDNYDKEGESWVDIVTLLAWQAASFVKPDATEGKAMDPAGCVKIKCIATGSRQESKLIKGLAFKKHAAHKHMATKYKNPRLLLIQGMLVQSSGLSGLSSFNSIIHRKDNLADLIESLDACHPNVIVVEKSAPRDVLEKVLKMGVTLVLDMKLHRLKRIARCTGSPILSSEVSLNQKLKHCDSLYFEKFVEEHAVVGEGGKKPCKTLMFLEGCPTRLGCTILLKGSHHEELKKIKCIVQCAIVMAYHFILETSFLQDLNAMFSTIAFDKAADIPSTDNQSTSVVFKSPDGPHSGELSINAASADGVEIPISDGTQEGYSHVEESTAAPVDARQAVDDGEDCIQPEDEISSVLDSESILVLMSSRNVSRGTICEQSHFSHIKFYRNFDALLGKFLIDNLFNQSLLCEACGEPPKAHFYYYAHQDKQLTIRVKRLGNQKNLPGESEGKLWMWSHCGKCEPDKEKATKRVLVSTAARGLSFGKFLELSFSSHSAFNRLSSCGHSFQKDFLYFFGLGPMVAMFQYSRVAKFTVSEPPQMLEFNSSINRDWLRHEIDTVYTKGLQLFTEVANYLKNIESQFSVSNLFLNDSPKAFTDIKDMLNFERSEFEENIKNKCLKNESSCNSVHELLSLNMLRWEILLEAYVWSWRLKLLLSSSFTSPHSTATNEATQREINLEEDGSDSSSSVNKDASERLASPPPLNFERSTGWAWNSFAKIREESMKEFHKGRLPKFGHLSKFEELHSLGNLPTVSQLIIEEGSRLHIPLSVGNYIVSDYDGEISSSIACALALMEDWSRPALGSEENTTAKHAESYDPDVIFPASSMSFKESHLPSFGGLNISDPLVSNRRQHLEVTLGNYKYPVKDKYSVVCMYANEFRALRNRCCPSKLDYTASLSRCKIGVATGGGKSKSCLVMTLDERLIIKEIKKTEFESFMKFAPAYFRHMKQSFEFGNQTCLAKILGIYQVTVRDTKSGKETRCDVMVQENLSFGRNITREYNLKGVLHARFTATADGAGDVLLDQNFVNDMNSSPLYIGLKAKRLLQRAVWNDTTFLNSVNVTDYSLLVGVDRQRRQLVCGIIDYLRQYTWDKQLETWVKSVLVVPKNVLPTIISPKEYKKRFRKFIDTHFIALPDHW